MVLKSRLSIKGLEYSELSMTGSATYKIANL